ncbi:DUF413 domain-containing protein [Neptuniibacter halophilus]|uniref:DUF413 domain-containing protein n=1 Tax=Neptuniibacter halophilus TaxID=651666 RepID=UPI002572E9C0|nr:DUF413 domain-containing protein [Neptuniibacter halophilus]
MMKVHDCFRSDGLFSDRINFPYGFLKSGEFTITQADLLEQHGQAYSELASGLRQPAGPEEQAFVRFCQGEKPAESHHERVWQRYLHKVQGNHMAISFHKRRTWEGALYEEMSPPY